MMETDPALLMPAPEESPYFPEKYPGKVCALCALGERSQLGQGEMLRIEVKDSVEATVAAALSSQEDGKGSSGSSPSSGDKSPKTGAITLGIPPLLSSNKRQKGLNKCKNPVITAEYVDELEKIGHTEPLVVWRGPGAATGTLSNLEVVVAQALSKKCYFCSRYGASLVCKMSCPKSFHYPCIAAAGGFQVIQSYNCFCKEHLGQVPLVCTDDINCRQCSALGDVGNLMMCSICGDHYHGTCVGLAQLPGVRSGWQCGSCKKCQICRVPDSSEGRTVGCEQCDKIYHASCLRPIMTSIPKYGWKCRCCRICSDCGSRTPGAGASSRWHAHFSVCDSCYQQRNKGFSCPICHRAYRAAAHREMVKCSGCNKFVHSTCDAEADLSVYHAKKETNPDYEYLCSPCKTAIHSGRMAAMRRNSSVDDDSMSASQESLNDESMDVDVEPRERIMSGDIGLGKGKPYVASKIAKKRLGLSLSGTNRPKGTGKGFQKKSRLADFSRKRGPKAKMRGIFGVPGLGLQRPTADSSSSKASEEEPGGDNRLVLCSAKDKFVLTQDICVMCGAIGTDQEGCLIACTQCGQCYHPYCTNVKVTKVILQKGWRCLDCTICEGCGQRNDEGRLILCDDCDISYHTYCMDPPLEQVPQGNWKCKWCAICLKCGTNDPGYNCAWLNNYSECGPCASQVSCPCCGEGYADGELIIQCNQCERWLHCGCDQIKSENEAERCAEDGYNCLLCRPHDQPPPHLVPKKKLTQTPISTPKSTPKPEEKIIPLALEGNHYVDGVCLSEHGLHQIKSLQAEFGKRGKRKPKLQLQPPPPLDKDDGILAAIESVVAGSSLDNSFDDVKLEPLDPREEAEIYKDGMVWNDPVPPEGFALVTNEQGVVVLRKKRQRNLQKLGIGGFFVRNRAVRTKDGKEEDEIADGVVPQISEESASSEVKPKKKPIRRKQKNKLIEIYPTILQDAFFGRPLLNSSAPTKFETQESDDDAKSDVSDDKTIKLTADELKYVEEMRIKQEEKQAQEQKALQQSMEQEQTATAKTAQPATATTQQAADEAIKAEEDDNSDTEALKDVLGLPNDLIEEDFVNRIMNDDEELTKTSAAFDELTADGELGDGLVKATKNELDILSPDFNLDNLGNMDSKEVEEIFKNVMTDESQESQESMFANSMTPYTSNTSTPSHSIDVTKKALPQRYLNTMAMQQHSPQVQQPQQQPPTPTSGPPSMMGDPSMQQQVNLGMQSPQTPQQQQMMNPMGMPSPHIHQSPQHQPMGGPGPTMMIQSPLQQQPTTPGTPIHTMQTTPTTPQPQHMQMMPTPPQQQQMQPNMGMLQQPLQQQQQMVMNQQQQQLNRGYYSNNFLPQSKSFQGSFPTNNSSSNNNLHFNRERCPAKSRNRPCKASGFPVPLVVAQWVRWVNRLNSSSSFHSVADPLWEWVLPLRVSMGPMAGASAAQKMSERMRLDEPLNELATISSVLYCNTQHPELKLEFPNWADRCKQIFKRWRLLSTEQKQPYLQQARDNRSAIRMKKSQQVPPQINTTPSPSNDTNTLDSLIGEGSNNKLSTSAVTTSTSITTTSMSTCVTTSTNPLVLSGTMSDNATSNVISPAASSSSECGPGGSNSKPNLLVAANIANTFINLASVSTSVSSNESGVTPGVPLQTQPGPVAGQPVTTHVMKTFTIGTNRGSIFVPNVIATNISPHFTVHHHQYGLRNGPAPNVTVNPNGNFNTNSSAVIRPGFAHIRPFLPQNANINFNIIGNQSAIQSPILAASLQTINKIAQQQQQHVPHPLMPHHHARGTAVNKIINVCPTDGSQKILLATTSPVVQQHQPPGTPSPSYSPQRSQTPNLMTASNNPADQQIRVLTPSEIMRTLPSLDAASYETANQHNEPGDSTVERFLETVQFYITRFTEDQDKINAQQKSMREAEQERQWKQLQQQRAREQQTQQHLMMPDQRMQDPSNPSLQLQVSTDGSPMGPIASPSPTRTQFVSPVSKNRMVPLGGQNPPSSPVPNFQHPAAMGGGGRPGMQIPLQQQQQQQQQRPLPGQQQRPNQSPFSPQSQPPQSPHEMLPGSPASQGGLDPFARPPSEGMSDQNYIHHSPQTPRSVGHQSPIQTPNRSPAYSGQPMPNPQTAMRINLDAGYAQAPGTPRPQFSNQVRPTVYARPGDLFGPVQTSPFTSPRSDGFNQPQPQEGNRQLRDLLQRQQVPASGPGVVMGQQQQQQPTQQSPQPMQPQSPYGDDQQQQGMGQLGGPPMQTQQTQQPNQQMMQMTAPTADNGTFRQPLPPNMMNRPRLQMPGGVGGIRAQGGPGVIPGGPRLQIVRTGGQMVITQQNILQQQQLMRQRMQLPVGVNRPDGPFMSPQGPQQQMMQQQPQLGQQSVSQTDQQNIALLAQRLAGEGEAHIPASTAPAPITSGPIAQPQQAAAVQAQPGQQPAPDGSSEIPDSVSAELEKLEQEDNAGIGEVEGVGDIFGGLADDDDELLDSLTAEMGADFNILEYADPELDTTDGEKSNLLDSLELDEPEGDKAEDKAKAGPSGEVKTEMMDTGEKVEEQKAVPMGAPQEMVQPAPQLAGPMMQGQMPLMQQQQMQMQPMQQQQQVPQGLNPQQASQLQQLIGVGPGQQMQQQQQQQMQGPPQQLQQQLLAGQMKTVRPNMLTAAHLQQIQQQMQQQVQQAAAMGKPMAVGTQLLSKEGAVGVVTANNNVSVTVRTGLVNPSRIQQLKMGGHPGAMGQQNMMPGQQQQQQQRIVQQIQGNRIIQTVANPNQPGGPVPGQQQQQLVGVGGQSVLHQQLQQPPVVTQPGAVPVPGQQQPPPPPYPEPPPPYPGSQPGALGPPQQQQQPNQDFENLLANQQQQQQQQQGMRVIQQNLLPGQVPGQPGQMQMQPQQLPPMQQQQPQQPGQLQSPMGGQYIMQQQRINPQWRPQTPIPPGGAVANLINPLNKAAAGPSQQIAPPPAEVTARPIAVYQANLQPAPPVPPENITNEQERQIQLNYENWMNQQKISLENQLKHYETEIGKLRKVKKQLNTKQRQLKKAGNELSEPDMKELTQITADHAVVQKQLDNARKQQRQHTVLIGEYKTKQQAKMQAAGGSPAAQIAPPSPLMSPSPSSQQNMIHQPMAQSPLNNPMLQQPSQSPLHSPGPLMSQSPGPASVNSVMQSPGGNHTNSNSAMSPYNTMQQSPRIGTPHSQAADENPFSPGPSPSPSLPGRLTSPAPRMTSPQHRMSGQPMPPGRMVTSPGGQYVQQNIIVQQNQMMGQQQQAQLQQQNRFVRPQIIPNDPNVRMRVANSLQQQQMMQQNANIRQMQPGGYNSPIGSPQPMDNSFNGGQNNQQPSGGGGGGGGINNPSNPIPIMPGFGKYGYIKLGLRGGSPMWGNARITKGPPQQQQQPQQQPQAGPSQQQSEAAKKAAMMRSRITIVQKAAASQATPIEEVIAVDSSPDEKQQRMLDYDDEVDKRLVTTEVSLSSVAQGAEGDDIMESFAHTGYEMRASPLGAQIVSSDYELFAQDVVVDCVDNGKEGEKEVAKKTTKEGEKGTNERNIATTEDFEAMIDSRPKDADGKPEEDFIGDEQAKTGMKTPTKDTTVISVGLQQSPKPITYPGRIAIQQTLLQNRPPIVSAVHKKLVKDATETTAKLSIGNTTISVPILKSFPMSATPPKEGGQSQQKQQMSNQAKKVMNSTAISLSSITKNPSGTVISVAGQKINTTSIVTLSSLNLNQSTLITKTFARTSVNNPHPSTSSASQIKIQPVQSITPGQSSQMEIIKSAKPKAPSPSLGYAKLSSLTVTQDTSLPTKIFEDDSVSPDSSIGQEDADQLDKVDSAALDDATRGIDGSTEGETPTVIATAHEGSNDSHSSELKKQGVIPVHVISKSRENSKSPILGPAGQRVISSVPQLSPLSQPNELTMNAMNVSQQVRSIMSSVNPATSGTNIIQVGTSKQELTPTSSVSTISTISFDTVIPGKGDNMSKPETIASILKTVSGKTILPAAAVANASNKPEVGQQQGTMAGGPTKLLNQQLQIGRISPAVSSAGNNILVVKQGGVIIQGQTRIQPAEIPKSSVDSSSTSSIASILSSTLQQPQTRIVNFSEVSTITSQPPPGLIMTSRPGVISSATSSTTTTSILSATLSQPMKSSSTTSASMSTLLQNQLQGPAAAFRRSKSTDEAPAGFPRETPAQVISKRLSLEASNPVKTEPVDNNDDSNVSSTVSSTTGGQGCKFSTISSNVKTESDSQNVLLKQLLQNTGTGGATSSPTPPPMARPPTNQRAPSLGVVSSLEAQLARPVIPPSANPPAMQIISTQSAPTVVTTAPPVTTEPQQPPQKAPTPKLISRETSFVSKPAVSISASHPTPNLAANMLAASIKKEAAIASAAAAAAGTTVQPITVQSTLKTESGPMTVTQITTHPVQQLPPQQQQQPQQQQFQPSPFSEQPNVAFVKREMAPMPMMQMHQQQQQQSMGPKPLEFHQYQQHQQLPKPGTPVEIKKELPEEQHQQMPMASMSMEQIKQEPPTTLSAVPKEEPVALPANPEAAAKTAAEIAHELKKKKRREYQKNRRQQQILSNKEQHQTNKKKPRKSTRQEEDYDTYIDSLMLQLRQLPPMQILEPLLPRNFGVCPLFGTGDLTKFTNAKDYSISSGDLTGVRPPPEPPAPASTQRGFYDQEFPPIKFETEDRYRYDFVKDRDLDSPDTIISTSSPECGIRWESPLLFPGLRVIKEEDSEDEQTMVYKRMSPIIPIVAPIPIRLKKGISLSADRGLSCLIPGSNKENEGAIKESLGVKSRFGPPTPLKDSSNVTVTVTLSSTAAEDIMGVLRDLANILEIPPPMAYEIVERTTTPPSQKLGLYRTKGRDGKEGAPIDIQTILNGAAKFCRHCDVVILNTLITAMPSEFPLLSSDASQELESEELYFCSKACYRQFQWRPTNILEDKLVGGDKSKLELDLDDNPSLNAADIKQELSEDADISMTSFKSSDSRDSSLNDRKKKLDSSTEKDPGPPPKQLKGIKFKTFSANCFPVQRYKKPTEKEITETLFRMSITVTPTPRMPDDTRRLLNYDVDKWVHLNCALWSDGVYETVNGALMNLENTLQLSLSSVCTFCNNLGATIKCFKTRCANVYHLSCAMKDNCVFYKNKSTMCQTHAPKTEKDSELTTLSVQRRVYVDRDESRQVASVMHHSESNNLLRVGSLIFLSVGQLLPHQLQSFHTPNYIYPIGYKIMRFYWSMRRPNKRCRYVCSIADVCGRPEFRVLVQEASEEDIELRDITPKAVWQRILDPMATLRKDCQIVQLFPRYISGEDLFGLTEPAVVRILESLPGIETLTDYRFKYGRNPLLELPLAINPSGAARTEPKLKHTLSWKKPHTQRTGSVSQRPTFVPTSSPAGEVACPYSKQFVHSKSSQYKKMKLEWRNNVFLARSKIQGLGLYAARDLEKHTMVIEYIGEVIRVEVSELREKQYEARNRGIYMFRLDEDRVVDATLSGGLARYINHSCNPNCVTEIVEVEREVRIIIFAKRRINRGEELSYDYKFDIEDDAHKISCMCGAPNCKKWMN
ncbi:hypothetical protein pipiens_014643 [Culex pipiens pipiens]|uniref:Histone-lysine N-methyltransferase 2C n=3 Tax=Culex pipiens TaxID=7175 RepID=A0ABD1CTN1_CULPP